MIDLINLLGCILVLALVVTLIVWLGGLPGAIAKERGHQDATAIKVAGWIGIFTFGLIWIVAVIWAYTGPDNE